MQRMSSLLSFGSRASLTEEEAKREERPLSDVFKGWFLPCGNAKDAAGPAPVPEETKESEATTTPGR